MPPNNQVTGTPNQPAGPVTPVTPQYPQASPAATPQVGYPVTGPPQPGTQPGIPSPEQKVAEQQVKQATNQTTSQRSLLFSEIRDGMIIMSDGGFRAVVSCESINFDLMSGQEREAIEYSYQNFLNSLTFPVQILVRSQRVDIAPYLDRLDAIRRAQDNMLLNVLTEDYLNFVDRLSQEANIMEKSFYIIVPFNPEGDAAKLIEQSKGFFGKIFAGNSATGVTRIDEAAYQRAKDELNNRVDSVMSGLYQVGVQSARLSTKQIGELYYNVYNPDTSVNQPLVNFQDQTTTFVRKGDGQALPPSTHLGGNV